MSVRYWEGRPVIFRAAPETGMSGYRYQGEYVRRAAWSGIHIVAEMRGLDRYEWQVKAEDMWPADEADPVTLDRLPMAHARR